MFDQVIIASNSSYEAYLKCFNIPKVTVFSSEDLTLANLPVKVYQHYNLTKGKILCIYVSGILTITELAFVKECSKRFTCFPLQQIHPLEEFRFEKQSGHFIKKILNLASATEKKIKKWIGRNCYTMLMPLIPCKIMSLQGFNHFEKHLIQDMHSPVYCIDGYDSTYITELYNDVCFQWLKLSAESLIDQGIANDFLLNYAALAKENNIEQILSVSHSSCGLLDTWKNTALCFIHYILRNDVKNIEKYVDLNNPKHVKQGTDNVVDIGTKFDHVQVKQGTDNVVDIGTKFDNVTFIGSRELCCAVKQELSVDLRFIEVNFNELDMINVKKTAKLIAKLPENTLLIMLLDISVIAYKDNSKAPVYVLKDEITKPNYSNTKCQNAFSDVERIYFEFLKNAPKRSAVILSPICPEIGVIMNPHTYYSNHNYEKNCPKTLILKGNFGSWINALRLLKLSWKKLMLDAMTKQKLDPTVLLSFTSQNIYIIKIFKHHSAASIEKCDMKKNWVKCMAKLSSFARYKDFKNSLEDLRTRIIKAKERKSDQKYQNDIEKEGVENLIIVRSNDANIFEKKENSLNSIPEKVVSKEKEASTPSGSTSNSILNLDLSKHDSEPCLANGYFNSESRCSNLSIHFRSTDISAKCDNEASSKKDKWINFNASGYENLIIVTSPGSLGKTVFLQNSHENEEHLLAMSRNQRTCILNSGKLSCDFPEHVSNTKDASNSSSIKNTSELYKVKSKSDLKEVLPSTITDKSVFSYLQSSDIPVTANQILNENASSGNIESQDITDVYNSGLLSTDYVIKKELRLPDSNSLTKTASVEKECIIMKLKEGNELCLHCNSYLGHLSNLPRCDFNINRAIKKAQYEDISFLTKGKFSLTFRVELQSKLQKNSVVDVFLRDLSVSDVPVLQLLFCDAMLKWFKNITYFTFEFATITCADFPNFEKIMKLSKILCTPNQTDSCQSNSCKVKKSVTFVLEKTFGEHSRFEPSLKIVRKSQAIEYLQHVSSEQMRNTSTATSNTQRMENPKINQYSAEIELKSADSQVKSRQEPISDGDQITKVSCQNLPPTDVQKDTERNYFDFNQTVSHISKNKEMHKNNSGNKVEEEDINSIDEPKPKMFTGCNSLPLVNAKIIPVRKLFSTLYGQKTVKNISNENTPLHSHTTPQIKIFVNYIPKLFANSFLFELSVRCGCVVAPYKYKDGFVLVFENKVAAHTFMHTLNRMRLHDSVLMVAVHEDGGDSLSEAAVDEALEQNVLTIVRKYLNSCSLALQKKFYQELNIWSFKTDKCMKGLCKNQELWHKYHSDEDRRRPLRGPKTAFHYGLSVCGNVSREGYCDLNFERRFHALRFKTNVCNVCPFRKFQSITSANLCCSVHPGTPDSFFHASWKNIVVLGLDLSLDYLVGAIRMMFKISERNGLIALFVSPSVAFIQLASDVICQVAEENCVKVLALVGDECEVYADVDLCSVDVILGTPKALWSLCSAHGGLGQNLRALIVDDVSTILSQPAMQQQAFAMVESIYSSNPNAYNLLNRVAIGGISDSGVVGPASRFLRTNLLLYNPRTGDSSYPNAQGCIDAEKSNYPRANNSVTNVPENNLQPVQRFVTPNVQKKCQPVKRSLRPEDVQIIQENKKKLKVMTSSFIRETSSGSSNKMQSIFPDLKSPSVDFLKEGEKMTNDLHVLPKAFHAPSKISRNGENSDIKKKTNTSECKTSMKNLVSNEVPLKKTALHKRGIEAGNGCSDIESTTCFVENPESKNIIDAKAHTPVVTQSESPEKSSGGNLPNDVSNDSSSNASSSSVVVPEPHEQLLPKPTSERQLSNAFANGSQIAVVETRRKENPDAMSKSEISNSVVRNSLITVVEIDGKKTNSASLSKKRVSSSVATDSLMAVEATTNKEKIASQFKTQLSNSVFSNLLITGMGTSNKENAPVSQFNWNVSQSFGLNLKISLLKTIKKENTPDSHSENQVSSVASDSRLPVVENNENSNSLLRTQVSSFVVSNSLISVIEAHIEKTLNSLPKKQEANSVSSYSSVAAAETSSKGIYPNTRYKQLASSSVRNEDSSVSVAETPLEKTIGELLSNLTAESSARKNIERPCVPSSVEDNEVFLFHEKNLRDEMDVSCNNLIEIPSSDPEFEKTFFIFTTKYQNNYGTDPEMGRFKAEWRKFWQWHVIQKFNKQWVERREKLVQAFLRGELMEEKEFCCKDSRKSCKNFAVRIHAKCCKDSRKRPILFSPASCSSPKQVKSLQGKPGSSGSGCFEVSTLTASETIEGDTINRNLCESRTDRSDHQKLKKLHDGFRLANISKRKRHKKTETDGEDHPEADILEKVWIVEGSNHPEGSLRKKIRLESGKHTEESNTLKVTTLYKQKQYNRNAIIEQYNKKSEETCDPFKVTNYKMLLTDTNAIDCASIKPLVFFPEENKCKYSLKVDKNSKSGLENNRNRAQSIGNSTKTITCNEKILQGNAKLRIKLKENFKNKQNKLYRESCIKSSEKNVSPGSKNSQENIKKHQSIKTTSKIHKEEKKFPEDISHNDSCPKKAIIHVKNALQNTVRCQNDVVASNSCLGKNISRCSLQNIPQNLVTENVSSRINSSWDEVHENVYHSRRLNRSFSPTCRELETDENISNQKIRTPMADMSSSSQKYMETKIETAVFWIEDKISRFPQLATGYHHIISSFRSDINFTENLKLLLKNKDNITLVQLIKDNFEFLIKKNGDKDSVGEYQVCVNGCELILNLIEK